MINHQRVLRLMREDNLLCLCTRGVGRTTDAAHALTVYPHLLPALTVDGLAPLWVADMTDLRLPQEFVYLAVLLDASSRRCTGWALDR